MVQRLLHHWKPWGDYVTVDPINDTLDCPVTDQEFNDPVTYSNSIILGPEVPEGNGNWVANTGTLSGYSPSSRKYVMELIVNGTDTIYVWMVISEGV